MKRKHQYFHRYNWIFVLMALRIVVVIGELCHHSDSSTKHLIYFVVVSTTIRVYLIFNKCIYVNLIMCELSCSSAIRHV